MTSWQIVRLILTLSIVATAFASIARASTPGNPAAGSAPQTAWAEGPSLVSAPVLNNNQPVLTSGPTA